MALSAPAVSAKLKAAGFGIVATRNREGIRVSRGALAGRVCVSVDLDRPGEQRRTAALLQAWLEDNASALGWAWSKHLGDDTLFTLTHKPLTPPAAAEDALVARAVEDMAAGKVVSFTTEPVLVAPEQVARRARNNQASQLQAEVRFAMLGLCRAVEQGTPPAQADVTAARTALEALIKLAEQGA